MIWQEVCVVLWHFYFSLISLHAPCSFPSCPILFQQYSRFLKDQASNQEPGLTSMLLTNYSCRANRKCQVITINAFFPTEKTLLVFTQGKLKGKAHKNAFSLHSIPLAWIRSIQSTADVLLLYNGNGVFYNICLKYFYFNTYIAVIGQWHVILFVFLPRRKEAPCQFQTFKCFI